MPFGVPCEEHPNFLPVRHWTHFASTTSSQWTEPSFTCLSSIREVGIFGSIASELGKMHKRPGWTNAGTIKVKWIFA